MKVFLMKAETLIKKLSNYVGDISEQLEKKINE